MDQRATYWEIDALKGVAMLGVLLIHAAPLAGSAFHDHLVDRAVPVLLVLFGVSSELWWTKRSGEPALRTTWQFWSSRLERLMPPVWVALLVWWLVTFYIQPADHAPSWPWIAAHALGYMPQVGTGWFVSLILQLVLLFPLLHLAFERAGALLCLSVSLLALIWFHVNSFQVIDWMRALLLDSAPVAGFFVFYYFWIFAPARFLSLFAGMLLARRGLRASASWSVAAAAIVGIGLWVHDRLLADPFARNALAAVLDIPLTVSLLALLRFACPARVRSVLCWLGRASWGIYLGQLVVHSTFGASWLVREAGSLPMRWLYCGCLLLGGLAWVGAERGVRRLVLGPPVPAASAADPTAPPRDTLPSAAPEAY